MQDGVGNMGARSDTASVISLTQSAIPRITQASAKDTVGGIFLRWKPLPPKPYFLGVQISRADGPESPYTPLDTVSLHDSTYFDKTVYSGRAYFYAIKAIMLRTAQEQPSVWVSAAHRNSSKPPLPVYGLEGEWTTERIAAKDAKRKERSGVRLRWQASVEQDIANYLVYRGLPGQPMTVISPPIPPGQTTFFDTDSTLSGTSLYVYAVRAVNFTGQESSDSKTLRIRPDKPVPMRPPVGFGGYEEYGTARLQWQPEAQEAYRVGGYMVYRRLIAKEAQREKREDIEQVPKAAFLAPAEEHAPKFGFKPLVSNATTATFFQDASVKEGELYEYAVSALDIHGNESGLSAVFRFALTETEIMPPSRVYAREVEKGVELSWSEQTESKGRKIVIYRRTEQESTPKRLAAVEADKTSFVDSNVNSNTLYIYSLRMLLPDKRESMPSYEVSIRKE
jgi:fibronectin type 3 domain-containing protein